MGDTLSVIGGVEVDGTSGADAGGDEYSGGATGELSGHDVEYDSTRDRVSVMVTRDVVFRVICVVFQANGDEDKVGVEEDGIGVDVKL